MAAIVSTGTMNADAVAPRQASLRDALWVWTSVAAAGIGGPGLQIATMHRLLVQRRRWISEDRFFHALSYCIALPGPETQQLAIYIGWLARRMTGAILAGGLFILPGVICMMALCYGYVSGANSQLGQALFLGVRPAILAIMAEALLRFGRHVLYSRWMVALAALAFLAAFFKLPFLIIVAGAAVVGFGSGAAGLSGFARPVLSSVDDGSGPQDDAALLDHTRPDLLRIARSLAIWLALWLAPAIALLALFGMGNIFTQIAFLFGKVATMMIGGDYAVVAYAAQQVVDSSHWLSDRELQDGIAMGEMVPGTIMIVTQFLGFMAAYRDPGLLPPLLAGAVGGLLATWMTFAPCFLWILAVGPFIDGLRRNVLLNSTLLAVTAAAVGMILNLSVWFGIRTLFHDIEPVRYARLAYDWPVFSTIDLWALALFVLAAIAVFRFKLAAAVTLLASAAIGAVLFLFGFT